MFFLPIGLEDAFFRRMPWISIGLAGILLAVFLGIDLAPHPAVKGGSAESLIVYYLQHPNVHPSKKLLAQVPGIGKALAHHKSTKRTAALTGSQPGLISKVEQARQQHRFDALTKAYLAAHKQTLNAHWGFTPADGLGQRGTLTAPFIARGWWALFWDLVLLYMVAPYLEDAWGRPAFAGLFAGGALLTSALFVAVAPESHTAIFGPGGAIAALFGAFTIRFYDRRVKIFWWFPLKKFGTFFIPAWLWAVFWLGSQVFWLGLGRYLGGGAALVPMLAAFGFGAAAALVVRATDFEARFVTPAIEGESFEQHASVLEAFDALAKGDTDAATAGFTRALAEDPGNVDARLGLARLAFEAGDAAAGTRHLDGLLTGCLARKELTSVEIALAELGGRVDPEVLRPTTAYRAAVAMEGHLPPEALEALYRIGARGKGALAVKAGLRAAELDLDPLGRAADAAALAGAVLALPAVDPGLRARAEGIQAAAGGAATGAAGGAATLAETAAAGLPAAAAPAAAAPAPAAPAAATRRIVPGRFAGRTGNGYQVALPNGLAQPLPRHRILGVAAGVVAQLDGPDGAAANVVILDLVLARDATAVRSLRFTSRAMGLESLFEATEPPKAFRSLVAELLAIPGIEIRPPGLARALPRFPDLAGFESAAYG